MAYSIILYAFLYMFSRFAPVKQKNLHSLYQMKMFINNNSSLENFYKLVFNFQY